MKLKLAHLAISVKNSEITEKFYCYNLGFTKKNQYNLKDNFDKPFSITLIENGNITLEIFSFDISNPLEKTEKMLDSSLRNRGVKHIAFYVNDIKKMWEKLKNNGVEFETDISIFENGDSYFFIKDPDGILVEIMECKK